jgi:hypothetical protein
MITTCTDTGCYCDEPDRLWNPLTDDGDALRLAVRLDIHPAFFSNAVFAGVGGAMKHSVEESVSDNKYAATRRAIVRAAAEIGKELS